MKIFFPHLLDKYYHILNKISNSWGFRIKYMVLIVKFLPSPAIQIAMK